MPGVLAKTAHRVDLKESRESSTEVRCDAGKPRIRMLHFELGRGLVGASSAKPAGRRTDMLRAITAECDRW